MQGSERVREKPRAVIETSVFVARIFWQGSAEECQFLILLHSTRHAFQLRDCKVLQQAGFGVKRPIERADPTLTVAGIDPVNQFLITELVAIALAMVNVSAIDFAMP